jgi:hypothetical protein
MLRRRHFLSPTSLCILFLTVATSGLAQAQDKTQIKEPPIPVIIGKNGANGHLQDEGTITLSVSDFNNIMEREDSLRRVFSDQTKELKSSSEKGSATNSALIFLLVLSNLITLFVARKRGFRQVP